MLASEHFDRHATYVGMSRHREGVDLHWSKWVFRDGERMVQTLSRARPKEMAIDFERAVEDNRELSGKILQKDEKRFLDLERGPPPGQEREPTGPRRTSPSSGKTVSGTPRPKFQAGSHPDRGDHKGSWTPGQGHQGPEFRVATAQERSRQVPRSSSNHVSRGLVAGEKGRGDPEDLAQGVSP